MPIGFGAIYAWIFTVKSTYIVISFQSFLIFDILSKINVIFDFFTGNMSILVKWLYCICRFNIVYFDIRVYDIYKK